MLQAEKGKVGVSVCDAWFGFGDGRQSRAIERKRELIEPFLYLCLTPSVYVTERRNQRYGREERKGFISSVGPIGSRCLIENSPSPFNAHDY